MKTHLSCSDWVNSFRINLVSTTLVCISIPLPCPALLPLSAFRSLCPALLRKMFKNRLREYAQKNSWPLPFFFFFSHNFNGKTPFFFTRPSVQRSILITSTEKHQRPISDLKPVTQEAYGGGLYGTEKDAPQRPKDRPPASQSQSADALAGDVSPAKNPLSRPPPPSSGDRDVDITGQSYIQ
jgi:hypothetical protein